MACLQSFRSNVDSLVRCPFDKSQLRLVPNGLILRTKHVRGGNILSRRVTHRTFHYRVELLVPQPANPHLLVLTA
jgi:hypothetical protein